MELKVRCHCGQKFKFDVEPVEGRMPFAVACPICGTDGTDVANTVLGQLFPRPALTPITVAVAAPIAVATSAPVGLRVGTVAASAPPIVSDNDVPRFVQKTAMPTEKPVGQGNIFLGILGAVIGAGIGAGVIFALAALMEFSMPILCILIGLLSGAGARLAYRGSDSTLGFFAAAVTLVAVGITMFFLFGFGAIFGIISLIVSVSTAWKIGSG
jgi:hypothetical protein